MCDFLIRNRAITEKQKFAVLKETRKRTGYYLVTGDYSTDGRNEVKISRRFIADALRQQFPGEEVLPLKFNIETFELAMNYCSRKFVEYEILVIEKDDQNKRIKLACIFPFKTRLNKDELKKKYTEVRQEVDAVTWAYTHIPYEIHTVLCPQAAIWDYHEKIQKEKLWKKGILYKKIP